MKLYWLLLITLGLFHNSLVLADDTEIYVAKQSTSQPNVVFLMDTSGSMGYTTYQDGVKTTRLAVVQEVAGDVITNTSGINIAIARFNSNSEGGKLSTPMLPIDNTGVRNMVREVLNDYSANGGTPITESVMEMTRFYNGWEKEFGSTSTDYSNLCMVWSDSGTGSSGTGTTTTTETTSTDVSATWWYQLLDEHSADFETYFLTSDLSSWKAYSDLTITKTQTTTEKVCTGWGWSKSCKSVETTTSVEDSNAYKILGDYGITEAEYGAGEVPWFMSLLDSGYWERLFDSSTGTYKSWDELSGNTKKALEKVVTQAQYAAYTTTTYTVVTETDSSTDTDDTSGLTCSEYLNLDDVFDGTTYVSPITDECQSNHIVLFTDGEPNSDSSSNSDVHTLLSALPSADFPNDSDFSTSCSGSGGCAEELAYAIYHRDNSTSFDGDQPIYLHTIGGFIGGDYEERLNDMATYGGGISGAGDDSDELRDALTKVFENITSTSGTFAAPAVTVNAFNNLEHLDQLYYSVFGPKTTAGWDGNVKRYRIDTNGDIRDVNDDLAVDSTTGYFADNAISYWTESEDSPDGSTVTKGGAARRLDDASSRVIVSNLVSNTLTASGNIVSTSNTTLKAQSVFADLSSDELTKVLTWLSGYDPDSATTTSRREMEDPLHSRPVLLTYGSRTNTISGEVEPDTTMFVGTNSGYLHAFDTAENNPKERFAFIPKDLFGSALAYYQNDTDKVYGLDGRISSYHIDTNRDDIIDSDEKAYIYVGMRRGGRNYYALDISDRDAPKLAWTIEGGSGDFTELGQTWSEMTPITILWNGEQKDVLVFGGGYDEAEDDYLQRTDHTMGNAIYIVDPLTGELIWKASNSGADLNLSAMTSSIVADITPVDSDGDGDVDVLYTADLGGRIWRIDLAQTDSDSANASSLATGGVIADLGNDNTEVNNVRFFSTPDISYTERGTFLDEDSKTTYKAGRYQIVIGSGYRAHPLNTTTVDNVYIINDFDVDGAPESYANLSKSDLADLKNFASYSQTKRMNGGYYELTGSGEKVLSDAITLSGTSYLTSYKPVSTTASSGCEPDIGESTVYTFSINYDASASTATAEETDEISDGSDTSDADSGSGSDTVTVNQSTATMPGIQDSPIVIYQEEELLVDDDCTGDDCATYTSTDRNIVIGLEAISAVDPVVPVVRTYWRELQ
ncbi:PilC/PilY family type IV pilus protein [Oceanobacter mangrovi]|uniref:PilC/PilY family type IV pilus protein n=1 Tax=Oceanobacter mangrovi TaxID=2862510 RepID=UPI001C8EC1A1|nr:PilC/PilY family type IV pilus protein [Oceanobacter mangrovi]